MGATPKMKRHVPVGVLKFSKEGHVDAFIRATDLVIKDSFMMNLLVPLVRDLERSAGHSIVRASLGSHIPSSQDQRM